MADREKILQGIRENSNDWVLILDTGVSDNMEAADTEFTEQIKQLRDEDEDVREKACQAIQENDYNAVKEILYGNVWNFQYSGENAQKERRKKYAEKLAVRKDINMEKYSKKAICSLLGQFSGVILTTCQDETIEAILEYERCSAVENEIYTPYSMTTSSHWKRQLENQSSMLIKLYGTCTEPSGLLLSEKDMNMYYPKKKNGLPVMEALDRLFQNKNLLFVGMNLKDEEQKLNSRPEFAPGIVELLKKTVSKESNNVPKPHRYAFVEETKEGSAGSISQRKQKEELGIEIVVYDPKSLDSHSPDCVEGQEGLKDSAEGDNAERINAEQKASRGGSLEDKNPENKVLTKGEAERVFWKYYNRRPKHHISKREMHILENHILKGNGQDNQEGKNSATYNRDTVIKIAMAANRFAEFMDLWKAMDMLDGGTDKKISSILNQRMDKKSRHLHQLLQFYGDGFPMRFLNLMAKDEEELDNWKKAVIRLDNNGAYAVSCNRKGIYERIAYADTLVQKAGIRIEQGGGCQKADSYLYPAAEGIDFIDIKDDKIDEKAMFRIMFDRILEILRDQSDGYTSLHPLLETEFHSILEKIEALENYDKEPELLYYLFRECRIQPRKPEEFLERIKTLRKEIDEKEGGEKKALCKKLMLYQVQMIVESQRSGCKMEKLSNLYEKAKGKITGYKLQDESIFILKVQLDLLAGKIYGLSAAMDDKKLAEILKKMESVLNEADMSIKERTNNMGVRYSFFKAELNYLYGDCQLMQCRLTKENGEDTQNTEKAEYQDVIKKYNDALKYYQKYTAQYKLQEADVWLRLAKVKHYIEQENCDKNSKECLKCLGKAYQIYRNYNNLHGIADVLQSLGRIENPDKDNQYYHAAQTIYRELGMSKAASDIAAKGKRRA